MSNHNQIIDGIQDQIDELLTLKTALSTVSKKTVTQTDVQPVIRNQATKVGR